MVRSKYRDAMHIVTTFKKPDLFVTFTCNPKWKEITDELALFPGQTAIDRPDLTARVFKMKLDNLMKDLTTNGVFGLTVAWMHTIEFQKRGLPHAHILIILAADYRMNAPEDFDSIVCAEIPDPETQPELHALVEKFMIHKPCNQGKKNNPCLKATGFCQANFPKEFTNYTKSKEDGYPEYQRRSPKYGGHTCTIRVAGKGKVRVGNNWVIPYNPYLLKKYNSHINVEVCCSILAIKYLYKYIYKGHDKVSFALKRKNQRKKTISRDEIKRYFDALYLSGSESCWKIFNYKMHSRNPNVVIMKLHLPRQHLVYYTPDDDLAAKMANEATAKTMLTEWFTNNKKERVNPLPESKLGKNLQGETKPRGPELLYIEYVEHYTWVATPRYWKRRTQNDKVIGRMHRLSPKAGESFYLRILLLHVRGAESWQELLTHDGTVHDSFKEACVARGLLRDDEEWHRCMRDAACMETGYQLLCLFTNILLHCNIAKPFELWTAHKKELGADIKYHLTKNLPQEQKDAVTDEEIEALTLNEIRKRLKINKKELSDYFLPEPDDRFLTALNSEIAAEQKYDTTICEQTASRNYETMNDEQKQFYDAVIAAIYANSPTKVFFLDALGGTGKTYVAETILAKVRSKSDIAIAVAFSGIAALLLSGGRTVHSRFNLPIEFDDTTMGDISRGDNLAELLRQTKVIIWDEAPMASRDVFECIDRTLRDIMMNEDPFGGKILVLSGDFRQVLPVIPRAARAQIVQKCINRSQLWEHVKLYSLKTNERVKRRAKAGADDKTIQELQKFAKVLEQIGDGRYPINEEIAADAIKVPDEWLSSAETLEQFIHEAFPNLQQQLYEDEFMQGRAILTPLNKDADKINNLILEQLPGRTITITSVDENLPESNYDYAEEQLNSFDPSGLPPHKLHLKQNAIIMLLRNMDPSNGACNGTRLKVLRFTQTVIEGKILTGPNAGNNMFIPKIRLYANKTCPIPFVRFQFPVKLAFAMTINKAQGQTLEFMALYLPNPVFGHGQLYVACGRVGSQQQLTIYIVNGKGQGVFEGHDGVYTRNVVYREVFDDEYGIEECTSAEESETDIEADAEDSVDGIDDFLNDGEQFTFETDKMTGVQEESSENENENDEEKQQETTTPPTCTNSLQRNEKKKNSSKREAMNDSSDEYESLEEDT